MTMHGYDVGSITDLGKPGVPKVDWPVPPVNRVDIKRVHRLYGLHERSGEWASLCDVKPEDVPQVMRDCFNKRQPQSSKVIIHFDAFSAFKVVETDVTTLHWVR